jgi:hypothetical protein
MKKRIPISLLAASLLLAGCSRERLAAPPPGVHLRAEPAITYYLDRGASDALELGVRESFQLWTDATAFKFSYGGKAAARVARDGRNQVVLMGRWPAELSIGDAAWTQVYLDASGRIIEGGEAREPLCRGCPRGGDRALSRHRPRIADGRGLGFPLPRGRAGRRL